MTLNFRTIEKADQEVVRGMIKQLYVEDPDGKPTNDEKIDLTFQELSQHPDKGVILVIENENKIVGYAILLNFWSNEMGGNLIEVDELFIEEGSRSLGIGTAFIKYLAQNRFNDCVAISLVVTPSNKRASELYQRIGFKLYPNTHLVYEL